MEGEAVRMSGLTGQTAAARETVVTGMDVGEAQGLGPFPFYAHGYMKCVHV